MKLLKGVIGIQLMWASNRSLFLETVVGFSSSHLLIRKIFRTFLKPFITKSRFQDLNLMKTKSPTKIKCVQKTLFSWIYNIRLLLLLRAYNAGHVLGAAMFMIEIAGVRVLYTGDFSREEDRHLMAAELPSASVRPGTTLRKFVSNIAQQPTRDNFIADKSVYFWS